MSTDPTNPYAPTPTPIGTEYAVPMDAATLKQFDAIVKDANQFWIAILLCLLCSGIGSVLIGVWYLSRLVQWNSMSKAYPLLMVENPPPGSMAARFQAAKAKLIIGLVVGIVLLFLILAYLALLYFVGLATQTPLGSLGPFVPSVL
jgi:hypothetical protein